jgi:hypothetical protein
MIGRLLFYNDQLGGLITQYERNGEALIWGTVLIVTGVVLVVTAPDVVE